MPASQASGTPESSAARKSRGPAAPTADEQHSEWLNLLRADGPFLALPVLSHVFGQGLDTVPQQTRQRMKQAWAEVCEAPDVLTPGWQELVLGELLHLPEQRRRTPSGRGPQPDAVVSGPDKVVRLHLYQRGSDEPLIDSVDGRPALTERAAQICRDSGVPLALLTNGRLWALVHARPSETTSTAVFDADLWFEEPALLRAFATLCCASRVLVPPKLASGEHSSSTAGLFARSAEEHTQVTTTLGLQVRQAVELFVAELARLDREDGGRLLFSVSDRDLYRGALTTMMRLVFLLFAEEQRLLPVTDPVYADGYAVSTLYDQLEADRNLHGEEIGDRRAAAWPRLMALFTAIHSGCEHPDLRIPAYGGSLFDPAAFPWLSRAAVSDRVVRELLDALLMLRHRGKAAERLSYARLGVEQIGHVYEGLLEFSCLRVDEPYVGLRGKYEPELSLTELESVADEDFPAWLREQCGLTPKQAEKALAAEPSLDQRAALHAACDNDGDLAERVLPFWGLLRIDLRGLPTVFPAGSVLFTQVGQRRSTGTHYTPRELAEEVVEHTLAPLCHAPGPAEGADPADWRVRPTDELLALKVVDPAMGSGAFLVAACRYVADRLLEAWDRDGIPSKMDGLDRNDHQLEARRMVAARCLYGVDRDDMAGELAKLSLWLVTLAKNQPFGFLDHALRTGDSLVGLVSREQVRDFHLDAAEGRNVTSTLFRRLHDEIDTALARSAELRGKIESSVVRDPREAASKTAQLAESDALTSRLKTAADAVVGAALSTPESTEDDEDDEDDVIDFEMRLNSIAETVDEFLRDGEGSQSEGQLLNTVDVWLRGNRARPLHPFHWPLEFPEVMNRGGFDAVIGNPPFIGGQRQTSSIGKDVREYLIKHLSGGQRGSADLCSYFLLRDLGISNRGRVGIIATNTIGQGDTREVGLDQVVRKGWSIYRAVKTQPWPGTASLEVSLVWAGHAGSSEGRVLDGNSVQGITPSLDAQSRVSGNPHKLAANEGQSFQGSNILGMGFTMPPEEAHELIRKNARNEDVLFPYLNGEDLNSGEPDCSASRWVINFGGWSLEMAQQYEDCFRVAEQKVKPQREQSNRKVRREHWWQFAERAPNLYEAIGGLERVLVITLVSKAGLPVWVPTGQVFSHKLGVFATDQNSHLTLLSSSLHTEWARRHSSTLETRLNYSPSDVFETFPQPELTARMDRAGERLHELRKQVMPARDLGLTKLYNLVHDPDVTDEDIRELREAHVEIDAATAEAYGWDDLDLGHDFHRTRQGQRFTIAEDARVELLDRLLELNHQRYEKEVAKGLHDKKKRSTKAKSSSSKSRGSKQTGATTGSTDAVDGLFPPEGALF